jgi:hypothetical protein
MRQFLIKICSPQGPSFHLVNDIHLDEVTTFYDKSGYYIKVIGIRNEKYLRSIKHQRSKSLSQS